MLKFSSIQELIEHPWNVTGTAILVDSGTIRNMAHA